jgi:hypothetical protein
VRILSVELLEDDRPSVIECDKAGSCIYLINGSVGRNYRFSFIPSRIIIEDSHLLLCSDAHVISLSGLAVNNVPMKMMARLTSVSILICIEREGE